MRTIDADELKKQFSNDEPYGPEEIRNIIDKVPIVVARPQGEWLFTEIDENYHVYGQCSVCKERNRIGKACRSCGADMRGEKMVDYKDYDKKSYHAGFQDGYAEAEEIFKRPQGEWIRLSERLYKCKNCGYIADFKYPFCHCGADMRGKEE